MTWIIPDFETVSAVDLKKSGPWRYAEDPTTDVLCLRWCVGDGPIERWMPNEPCPPALLAHMQDPAVLFIAHNADFEKAIWRKIMGPVYGWPDIPNKRWHDTAARAAQLTLPRKLEKVLIELDLPVEKDMEGNRLTVNLSRINKRTGMYPETTPEIRERDSEYCAIDVEGQRALHRRIGWLDPMERTTYLIDQDLNERGIKLDLPLIRNMQKIVAEGSAPLAAEFKQITGGLEVTQVQKIGQWLAAEGVALPDLRKETLDELFGEEDDEVSGLPAHVDRALRIRRLIGSASVKKLNAMELCVSLDGRARGLTLYHAAGTGRWAGRLLQPQNFPRGSLKVDGKAPKIEGLVDALMTGDWHYVEAVYGPAVETVVSSLRHTLVADEGSLFVAGDYAGIEARVVLALAGQYDKCDLLASGADVYADMACDIYDLQKFDVSDKELVEAFKHEHLEERQIGKNTVLGCGFQMGKDKFHDRYCPHQPIEFAEKVIKAYRKSWAPKVPYLWYGLEDAAVRAVHDRRAVEAYGIVFAPEDMWLTARLPSGRKLWYFKPRPVRRPAPWDENELRLGFTYRAQKNGHGVTTDAYGGLLTENVVQATARDILRHAMVTCYKERLPMVLTVHDELVLEVPEASADFKVLAQIMEDVPAWCRELKVPVAVEGWAGKRYRK